MMLLGTFKPIDTDQQVLTELKTQLEKDGYNVTFNDGIYAIGFNPDDLGKRRNRGAGRKHKTTDKTCRDLFLYRQDHSQKQAAELLGVSVRTYQRMEKYAKDAGFWADTQAAADTWFERSDTN